MCFAFLKTVGEFTSKADTPKTAVILVYIYAMGVPQLLTAMGVTNKIGLLVPNPPSHGRSGGDHYGHSNYSLDDRAPPVEYEATVRGVIVRTRAWLKEAEGGATPLEAEPRLVWGDSGSCDERTVLGETVKMKESMVGVIIGPPCTSSVRVVGLLGSYSRIPVITWAPVQRNVMGDGVISTYGSYEDFTRAAFVVMRHLKWTKTAIFYERDGDCDYLIEEMRNRYLVENEFVEAMVVMLKAGNNSTLADGLVRAKVLTRTIIVCAGHVTMQTILQTAEVMKMTSGQYAFLYLSFDFLPFEPQMSEKFGEARRDQALLGCVLQLGHFPRATDQSFVKDHVTSKTKLAMSRSQYFHDAVALAVVVAHRANRGVNLGGYNITAPHLQTGAVVIDDHGVRRSSFHLIHYQGSRHTTVATVTADLELVISESIMWPGGRVPESELRCDVGCSDITGVVAGCVVGAVLLLAVMLITIFIYRKYRRRGVDESKDWIVEDKDVKRRKFKTNGIGCGAATTNSNNYTNGVTTSCNGSVKKRLVRMETRGTIGLGSNCSLDKSMLYAPIGNYKDMVVAVKHVRWTHVQLGKKEMKQDLKMVKELSHDNINQFIGACVSSTPGGTYVLFRYCPKGSLQDVLENDDIKLDWMFKLSFALDLARGMEYLHKTPLRSHGNLKSSNCVIDSRWVLKITDFGAVVSYRKPHTEGDPGNRAYYSSLLWSAPELLRMGKRPQKGTQKGDVYSFGIILQEILLRCGPYLYNNKDPAEIINLVKSKGHSRPPYRPILPNENDCPAKATSLMVICWSEEPEARPDFHNIRKKLREFNGHKRFNIMDNMLQMLETYSSNLEVLVNERTEELEAEKRKTDTLLYQMLPPLVAEQLKSGMCVIPEYYDHVSIFFSDIVGFTAIASQSKPLEVVDLLNDLYTCFDEVIARRDVYKVETIGDAYMCVSGCPKRNGPRHAGEIANMALDLISAVTHFRIRHKPEETLNLRVGLHTGPCAAGVVGRTMPRYCLFGDTVNMASRMESTGKALHIHMSCEMKEALDDLDWGFLMVDRGFIEVKGKGLHKTFWLVGKKNYKKPLPESLVALQKKLEDGDNPPTPSYCTLTVGDSMFSALRKTSITISNITVENTPYTSDSEDAPGAHHVNAADAAGRGGESGLRSASAVMSSVPKRRYATVQPVNLVISTEAAGKDIEHRTNEKLVSKDAADRLVAKDAADRLVAKDPAKCDGDTIGCDSSTTADTIAAADSQDRERHSPVRQPIKKDSACYSLADVGGDHDANKTASEIDFSCDSVTDLTNPDSDLTVISCAHRSVFGDSESPECPVGADAAAAAAANRSRAARKKYLERRAEHVESGEIPRIEIT